MVAIRRVPKSDMDKAHAEYRARRRLPAPATVTANVRTVLEIDGVAFVTFRGRAFGVPPVGWRLGQRILALRMAAARIAEENAGVLTAESSVRYYAAFERIADVLWSHLRPVGFRRRLFRSLGLLRNPLREATEAELVALTDFLLRRRMTSGVGVVKEPPSPYTMPSTI